MHSGGAGGFSSQAKPLCNDIRSHSVIVKFYAFKFFKLLKVFEILNFLCF